MSTGAALSFSFACIVVRYRLVWSANVSRDRYKSSLVEDREFQSTQVAALSFSFMFIMLSDFFDQSEYIFLAFK